MIDRPAVDDTSVVAPLGLPVALAGLGSLVLSDHSLTATAEEVATLAAAVVPGTSAAGLALAGKPGQRGSTPPNPGGNGSGAAAYGGSPRGQAWGDQVSVPLVTADQTLGVLTVYAERTATYDEQATRDLQAFARQATVLLVNAQSLADAQRLTEQLREALSHRDVIGQAKGVLIASGAGDEQAAFEMLASASQRSNTKLHQVARQVVDGSMTRLHLGGRKATQ